MVSNFALNSEAPFCCQLQTANKFGQSRGVKSEITQKMAAPRYNTTNSIHNKVISGFQALRQARAPVAGLEPATEWSLQISGRTRKPLCYRRPCTLRRVTEGGGLGAGSQLDNGHYADPHLLFSV
ncbi:hypothetical protein PoB_002564200 [Plakobranchus ocellatus]|uniref:Uncharacterized protein n=1 Tax=Plakobranchus ocellatus TaxID=259542 RepID=A0AAV3ZVN6_9GAST|nr:hypothetical protein PoB_002564200 [Plakobranchus ocellatus]